MLLRPLTERPRFPSTTWPGKMAQSSRSCHRVLEAPGLHLQALWFSQPPISSDGITDHRGATFPKFLFLGEKWLPCHAPGGRFFSGLPACLAQGTQKQDK